MILGLIPSPVGGQVRYFDRMQTQPQAPSRWETAIHNAQEGRVSVGRRMQKDKPSAQAQPGQVHDQALAMPHWTSSSPRKESPIHSQSLVPTLPKAQPPPFPR
jgi:hypothetical protein